MVVHIHDKNNYHFILSQCYNRQHFSISDMTQKLPASLSFEPDILDNAFYQPDVIKNNHHIGENHLNVTNQYADIAHLEQTLEAQQQVLDDISGIHSPGSYFIFFFISIVFIASVFFISYEWVWKFFTANIDDKITCGFLGSVLLFFPNIFGAAALTDVINAWRLNRFKKTMKGKKLICNIEHLSVQIERAQADLHEQCQSNMTEIYFFQTLKKFDAISTRIKTRYPENFLDYCDNSDMGCLDNMRDTLVDYFSQQEYQLFCLTAEKIDHLEASFEKAWQNYCVTDKAMLMKKYQDFLNHDTSEIEHIL
jgi:hypothetical protein